MGHSKGLLAVALVPKQRSWGHLGPTTLTMSCPSFPEGSCVLRGPQQGQHSPLHEACYPWRRSTTDIIPDVVLKTRSRGGPSRSSDVCLTQDPHPTPADPGGPRSCSAALALLSQLEAPPHGRPRIRQEGPRFWLSIALRSLAAAQRASVPSPAPVRTLSGELGWAASRGERNRKRKILTQLSPDPSEWQKILLSMSEGICHQHAIRAGSLRTKSMELRTQAGGTARPPPGRSGAAGELPPEPGQSRTHSHSTQFKKERGDSCHRYESSMSLPGNFSRNTALPRPLGADCLIPFSKYQEDNKRACVLSHFSGV